MLKGRALLNGGHRCGGATPGCFFFRPFATLTAEKQLSTVVLENQLLSPDLRVLIGRFTLAFCFLYLWLFSSTRVYVVLQLALSPSTIRSSLIRALVATRFRAL